MRYCFHAAIGFVVLVLANLPYAKAAVYTQIDGRWYKQASANPFGYYDGLDWYLPGADANSCYRSDGQQQQFGWMNAYTSFQLSNVYDVKSVVIRGLRDEPGSSVVAIRTASGTVRCTGQIASHEDDHIFDATFGNEDWLPPLSTRITIKLTGPNVPPGCKFYTNPRGLRMEANNQSGNVASARGVWDAACFK